MIPQPIAVLVVVVLAIAIVLAVIRAFRGPTAADAAVAGDLIFFAFIAMLGVFALLFEIVAVMDLILVAAILGFLSVISLARLIQGGAR